MWGFIILAIGTLLFVILKYGNRSKPIAVPAQFPAKWRTILQSQVEFYQRLSHSEKDHFENDILEFLSRVKITGIQTKVEDEDRLLVAASAAIVVFGFPEWRYQYLREVLLYPSHFDRDFNFRNPSEMVTGMVGNGPMEGVVIFSKPALHQGFDITSDKKNVGIHEFVHLFDKEDGVIDGIPPGWENQALQTTWLQLIQKKVEEITEGDSDINPYGATNRQEFLAVASEYFFERPALLKKKHPELYDILEHTFRQSNANRWKKKVRMGRTLRRNDPCPCGSGLKYKKCCLSYNA
ncbi:zinc-dependent peptidase [bacterium SCSIO 12741]|nr:zinc-dependent peptidase [bacterium SCSIO 12741]